MGPNPVALYSAIYSDLYRYDVGVEPNTVPGISYRQFASTYLLRNVTRKLVPKHSSDADQAALASFVSANNRCRDWQYTPGSWAIEQIVDDCRSILDDFFHPGGECLIQSYFDLWKSGRPGPGAGLGCVGTSYYTKFFASKLSCTSEQLYSSYSDYVRWIPTLCDAEFYRYHNKGYPDVVSGSRCCFVPKTTKTSRMVCVEPNINMFAQLGLGSILESRLKAYFNIDIATQPEVNRRLAKGASIDGSYATIDLSSASDSISLRLCEYLLPKWFFELLLALRSRTTEIAGSKVPLFMVSTMGNGFTFPLQSILFSSIVRAVNRNTGNRELDFSVFGDDIICRTSCAKQVLAVLETLGFIPNPDKTFIEGPFRESCGADWFNGQPVRPVFIKYLDTPQDTLVAINQLNVWSALTGIALPNAIGFLLSHLGRRFRNAVPFVAAEDSGIRVPLALVENPKRNANLSFLYKSWEKKVAKLSVLDEGSIRAPKRFGKLLYNPSGLYYSFLYGELSGRTDSISIRLDGMGIRTKRSQIPFWDHIPIDEVCNGQSLSWKRWETAVLSNLSSPL